MYKYILSKDNKSMLVTVGINSIKLGAITSYLHDGWDIDLIFIDEIILFEKP